MIASSHFPSTPLAKHKPTVPTLRIALMGRVQVTTILCPSIVSSFHRCKATDCVIPSQNESIHPHICPNRHAYETHTHTNVHRSNILCTRSRVHDRLFLGFEADVADTKLIRCVDGYRCDVTQQLPGKGITSDFQVIGVSPSERCGAAQPLPAKRELSCAQTLVLFMFHQTTHESHI